MMKPLVGRVAVVAGATRGAGRGIARGLGEAGATVYCTGRSVRGRPSPYGRSETIEETAELVTAAGGVGVAVQVDHTVPSEVRALFERVEREQGRLDVLADSVAGEDPLLSAWTSFLETDLDRGETALRQGLLSHIITAQQAAALMIKKRRGLIVEVNDYDLLFGPGNALAQVVKFALRGLPVMLSQELRRHRVAAVAITPGFLRSETMLEHFGVTETSWRDGGKKDKNFLESESPLFLGRAVAALAADPKVVERSGELLSTWELAREYGFTDAGGHRPDWGKHATDQVIPAFKGMREGLERHVQWLERLAARARAYLGEPASGRRVASR
jgi:NAD(P)-dependent dehydrogenase (short-subunit alcohol dehydrogenase family)